MFWCALCLAQKAFTMKAILGFGSVVKENNDDFCRWRSFVRKSVSFRGTK